MEKWWCVECDTEVGLNKHGMCGVCGSESVYLLGPEKGLNCSLSATSDNIETDPDLSRRA
jgi:hypothetical protein